MGASVRGAIDLVKIERELARLRTDDDAAFEDAAIAALSGRLRLEEGSDTTAEAIVRELIDGLIERPEPKGKAAGLLPGERAVRCAGRPRARSSPSAAGARCAAISWPARTGSSSRSRPRSDGSTRPPSETSCARTPTRLSRCSPTSARPPIRSCAHRPGGSPRACSCAPGGSARAPPAATAG
jgi:hypothetical protein